jgi:hypothetical protein
MVRGYYYTEEQAAISAVALVNAYYGCPMEGVETWTTCQAWGEGWAIIADESLVAVLGEAVILPQIEDEND